MNPLNPFSLAAVSIVLSTVACTAAADVQVRFVESAPKDRFVVANTGNCELKDFLLEVDLSETKGQLIFDTTSSGAGVEVFQPFEQREGEVALASATSVADGDRSLSIRIAMLPINDQVSFTIDVDDTLTNSELGQIRVTGAEIQNGVVTITGVSAEALSAVFNENSEAVISGLDCAD